MSDTGTTRRTVLYDRHVSLGAKMVDFAGWEMPIQYPTGILEEHLRTRAGAGVFDICHMGRFLIRGPKAAALLDGVLTNDATSLVVGKAQYTLFPTATGGVVDDAFLYRPAADTYLLVVNAANRQADWDILRQAAHQAQGAGIEDVSQTMGMISLQGPLSPGVLARARGEALPTELAASGRNTIWELEIGGRTLWVARTGYAGEPLGYELLPRIQDTTMLWDLLLRSGAMPVGLGARDTLRLEAGLPLHGHELGLDPEGREIPAYACAQTRTGVRLSPHKLSLAGRDSLERQAIAWRRLRAGDPAGADTLPYLVRQLTLTEPGVARPGSRILAAEGARPVGWVTSGTVVPTWVFRSGVVGDIPGPGHERRAALLGLVEAGVPVGSRLLVDARGRRLGALVVRRLLDGTRPPYARPVRLDT